MSRDVNFSRKIYVILIIILFLGVIIQVSRSQFALEFQQNSSLLEKSAELKVGLKNYKPPELQGENYCIAYVESDDYSLSLKDNSEKALQYMQKKSTLINLSSQKLDWKDCHTVIVALKELNLIGNANHLDQYVYNGGYILFAGSLSIDTNFEILYRKFGITSFGYDYGAKGIELITNVLIGEKHLNINDDFLLNSSLSIELDNQAELLATSTDGNPLLWKRNYGSGSIMFFNGSMLQEKINRGIFTGALSLLEPVFMYPIFNSKVFYIDDFPAPTSNSDYPSIREEYNRNISSFYKDIWWPDMLKAAKGYNLKYTGEIIETYNDQVHSPFSNPGDQDRSNLISYGRELIKSGGEMGLHGYNHQSLVTDEAISKSFDYKPWNSQEDMSESIKEVLRFTQDAFPNYALMSYVPPSNVLDSDGREALKNAWPSLTVISSLYGEDATGNAYIQEYEIAEDGIIEMPRVTSGYLSDSYDRWAEANTITSLGVFSHFIHPDDVLNEERSNGQNWEDLYKDFNDKLARLQKTYPWIRSMTATEAALDMATSLSSQVHLHISENQIKGEIFNYQSEVSYILRTDKKIGIQNNCQVKKIDTNTYLVIALHSNFDIQLGGL